MLDNHTTELIHGWLDGGLDDRAFAELEAVLAESPEARRQFWDEVRFHSELHDAFKIRCTAVGDIFPSEGPARTPQELTPPRSGRRFLRRQAGWLAAAVTIVLGGCGLGSVATSLSLAYAGWSPAGPRPVVVLHEGFEDAPAPRPDFVPRQPGFWSGDVTRVVGAEQGLKPKAGRSMLRFVGTSPAGESPAFNIASELWRLVDLTDLRRQLDRNVMPADLDLRLTATFNGIPVAAGRNPNCSIKMIATDAEPPASLPIWLQSGLTTAQGDNPAGVYVLAAQQVVLDADPGSWQRLTVSLHVPAKARFLMLYCVASDRSDAARDSAVRLEGQYVDEIELTARPATPQP